MLQIKNGSGPAKMLGITAAHAILDNFLTMAAKRQLGKNERVKSRLAALRQRQHRTNPKQIPKAKKLLHPPSEVAAVAWESIEAMYAVNWLDGGWEAQFRYPFSVVEPRRMTQDADFALLELPPQEFVAENTYRYGLDNNQRRVTWILTEEEICSAEVDVTVGRGEVVKASLLALRSRG